MILAATAVEASADTFTGLMDHVAEGFEALGAAILIVGVIWSFILAAVAVRRSGSSAKPYLVLRQTFGGTLLLGLEVLVAADLVRTVAVAPTLDNVLVLGLIVVIRTFLSFSLETEIEGTVPWRRAAASGRERRGNDPPGHGQRTGPRDAPLAGARRLGPVAIRHRGKFAGHREVTLSVARLSRAVVSVCGGPFEAHVLCQVVWPGGVSDGVRGGCYGNQVGALPSP
jgi:uncharacterized membrane protein